MSIRNLLVASCALNVLLAALVVSFMSKGRLAAPASGSTLSRESIDPTSKKTGGADDSGVAAMRIEDSSIPEIDTTRESDGAERKSAAAAAHPRIDPKLLSSLAQKLGGGQSSDELPCDELRRLVADALEPTQSQVTESHSALTRAIDASLRRKIADGKYEKLAKGASMSFEGEGVSSVRNLPDGTMVHLTLRPGEFPEYDDATRRERELQTKRMEAVTAVLEAWNAASDSAK